MSLRGGSLDIDNIGPGRLVIAGASRRVEVRTPAAAHNDFNGDGRSDILWRHNEAGRPTGSARPMAASSDNRERSYQVPGTNWQVAGTGDFNGDGRDDILWRHDNGRLTDWLGPATAASPTMRQCADSVPTKLAGRRHRRLQRRRPRRHPLAHTTTASSTNWLGQANGGFATMRQWSDRVPTSWHIAGTGDFNGDGRDDILWRNDNGDDQLARPGQRRVRRQCANA